jgi:Zinc knuckle
MAPRPQNYPPLHKIRINEGSPVSVASERFIRLLVPNFDLLGGSVVSVGWRLCGTFEQVFQTFLVMANTSVDFVLGRDFLDTHKCAIDRETSTITYKGHVIPVTQVTWPGVRPPWNAIVAGGHGGGGTEPARATTSPLSNPHHSAGRGRRGSDLRHLIGGRRDRQRRPRGRGSRYRRIINRCYSCGGVGHYARECGAPVISIEDMTSVNTHQILGNLYTKF